MMITHDKNTPEQLVLVAAFIRIEFWGWSLLLVVYQS